MRIIVRLCLILFVLWVIILMSGYGVLMGSEQNVGGLGIQCRYLTARHVVTAQYLHSDSTLFGVSSCPLLRKTDTVVDNGN